MSSGLPPERIAELREKGIVYVTRSDVLTMQLENADLKRLSYSKLRNIVFLAFVYSALMIAMSVDLVIPRIGDIGAYKPDGEVVLLHPRINPPVGITHAYNYAVDVVQTIRTYRFLTYVEDIFASEKFFSKEGFNQYLLNLESSGHIARVMDNKENRLSIVSSKQKIWASRAIEGSNAFWYISIKLLTRIEKLDGKDELVEETVNVKLKEVPRNISKSGLLIEYIRDQ
jgi:hypothetical protein